jgi:hypothetical protein
MLKLNLFVMLGMVAVAGSMNVQAANPEMGNPGGSENTPSLSWEQFKESCLHPEQFNHQNPPSNIRIQCSDTSREFVSASPGQVQLPAYRRMIYAVFSNKFHVNAEQKDGPMAAKGGTCMRFKEIERTVTVERKLNCSEVLGIKSDLADYCASIASAAKSANPKLVDTRETGRGVDTCSNPSGI